MSATCQFCGKAVATGWDARHARVCVKNPDVWSEIVVNIDDGNGCAITPTLWAKRGYVPSAAYLIGEFGSWDELASKVGLQPSVMRRPATRLNAPLTENERRRYWDREREPLPQRSGRPPAQREVTEGNRVFVYTTF